ncbi:hypothetical protein, partial [Methanothrix soehngenii]|uniref:hypothetical protein n=1 Tax=Methanothrix soehngenii TaxID=2223 RepID=UPI00300C2B6C
MQPTLATVVKQLVKESDDGWELCSGVECELVRDDEHACVGVVLRQKQARPNDISHESEDLQRTTPRVLLDGHNA